jgi:hypothetical protein
VRTILAQYNFVKRLALLLAIDFGLTVAYSYVPLNWTALRSVLAVIEFGVMALTMWVAVRRVAEDF